MSVLVEVCVDSLESLEIAVGAGAGRIELCSSLDLGGLTPSFGLMKQAATLSTVPVYAMIRARQGDFLFSEYDKQQMLMDIEAAKQSGIDGVVIGALLANGEVDMAFCQQAVDTANGMGVTFHRAIDHCKDPIAALEQITQLGVERVLTSGGASTAESGLEVIAQMVKNSNGRVSIMPGAGVNAGNAHLFVEQCGVTEVHLSGKSSRSTQMTYRNPNAFMGSSEVDDFDIPVTSAEKVAQAVASVNSH